MISCHEQVTGDGHVPKHATEHGARGLHGAILSRSTRVLLREAKGSLFIALLYHKSGWGTNFLVNNMNGHTC